ncbi:hypothetical protein NAP1_02675 [Erythrobacter sp. NAP1]|uniref:hypothetical protein n=1 Tax=Erythrobacter sp. NAP1 TaxID=237727 RepID=UPI0000686C45|nr:hypothetical protein [Erythrobacter sp. NAP1]EAQ29641.1 hypothetical protein NAP1_02675 [Erythrobacter sp. NAP1]
MTIMQNPKAIATALLASLSLLLTGCFITPGKFTSELVLMEENRFSFTYEGEIFFIGLSNLAAMGAGAEEFEPSTCYDDDTFDERECTEAELAEQRAEWDAGAEMRAAEAAQQAEQMSAMMGGIDPNDPEASAELARLLMRQKGWERVEDKGEGVFDVLYRVEGELSHDFMFPVIEDVPMTNPFVQMVLRDEGVVRINAPGFSANNDANPMAAMGGAMGGMAGLAGMASMGQSSEGGGENAEMPNIPTMEGTFRIVTSGRILANNTDEGPSAIAGGEALEWAISPRTQQAPTALIDTSR